jgi:hypothetical protein
MSAEIDSHFPVHGIRTLSFVQVFTPDCQTAAGYCSVTFASANVSFSTLRLRLVKVGGSARNLSVPTLCSNNNNEMSSNKT